ncbi:hypothetical protein A6B37_08805 [Achromobacter sp. HZ01]|uniref:Membrane lipoprotein, cell wall extensin motif n=2 Tax=Achromobacter TaxID=222 RepID=A0A2N8KQK3_9BURK|nr:hypothetical protein [Achromobacter xylosoxidans]PND35731.1 hypothetical protein C1I89_05060 [Achromobacter pulmonis]RAP66162.1 hypothetical protein A6B37_08805 [Achromobacter sp. HZ01]
MKKITLLCVGAFIGCAAVSMPAMADHDDHRDYYYGGHHGGKYKQEYWDGNCKVERKWKRNGDYKEERKCKAPRPVVYPAYPQPVYPQPGVVIQGTAVIR